MSCDDQSVLNHKVTSKRASEFSDDDRVEVTIAPNAGTCFGVKRAIKLGRAAVSAVRPTTEVSSFGPLIHNPKVVEELSALGLKVAQSEQDIVSGTVVLRSHGVREEIEERFRAKGLDVVDATCPLVKRPQRMAKAAGEKGYYLIVVGDAKHPEIQGVLSYYGLSSYLVTYNPTELALIPTDVSRVVVIAQTTIEYAVFEQVVSLCRQRFDDVVVHNTICNATSVRQTEADALAKNSDVVVVVGGRNSSNTRKLEKICMAHQPHTYLIEDVGEIKACWFSGKKKIGVTGGASTPVEFVDYVGSYIARIVGGGGTSSL